MTLRESASALGITRQRVAQLIDSGKLVARKVATPNRQGFYWDVPRAEVERRKAAY